MKNRRLSVYYMLALAGVLAAAAYPLYMAGCVIYRMATDGTLTQENFPKYIIPYAPISLAVLVATALMPIAFRYAKKYALPAASLVALAVFFTAEWLLESRVIVTTSEPVTLESWQMFMCYVPLGYKQVTAIDILMGQYSPAFKLHFYLISVLLILPLLNCLYGYGRAIRDGQKTRLPGLGVQAVCTVAFLGMCIWACFTAFYRTGEQLVSPLSALLMCVFFLLLGVVSGTYIGSFLSQARRLLAVAVPAAVAALTVIAMYVGELCLLSGQLYRFGTGFWFDGLPGIVLSPVDIAVVLLSGAVCGGLCALLQKHIPRKAESP